MLVRPAAEMSDEHFQKHLELRHCPKGDWAGLRKLGTARQFNMDRRVYEAWHTHCHKEWPQSYDHEHSS